MTNAMNRRQVLAGTIGAAAVTTPVVALSGRERLESLIEEYRKALTAYNGSLVEDDDCDSPEWDAYIDAESALIAHPCTDDAERRAKITFATTEKALFDTLQNDRRGEVPELLRFLRSLA